MWWCVCNRIWILLDSVFYLYCDYFGCNLDGFTLFYRVFGSFVSFTSCVSAGVWICALFLLSLLQELN